MFISFVPYFICKYLTATLGNVLIRRASDGQRSQETWFAFAVVMVTAVFLALEVCCHVTYLETRILSFQFAW